MITKPKKFLASAAIAGALFTGGFGLSAIDAPTASAAPSGWISLGNGDYAPPPPPLVSTRSEDPSDPAVAKGDFRLQNKDGQWKYFWGPSQGEAEAKSQDPDQQPGRDTYVSPGEVPPRS